jgi:methionine synthase I (cobalamin-dependent)
VPTSALRQKLSDEKYIRTSIADRNLQHLSKFITRKLQEEVNKETPQYVVGAFGPIKARISCHIQNPTQGGQVQIWFSS